MNTFDHDPPRVAARPDRAGPDTQPYRAGPGTRPYRAGPVTQPHRARPDNQPRRARPTVAASAAALLALAGCASFSPEGGMDTVAGLTRERTGHTVLMQREAADADTAAARSAELLREPLGPDGAVELALLNNRGLQARLQQLGIAEAELVQAGRLRNPVVGFGRMALGGGAVEIDRSVMFDLLELLTLPAAQRLQRGRFEAAQLEAAAEAVRLAADTRRAFFQAVAARELLAYFTQVQEAAELSSELARRMLAAGNFSRLEQLREQGFHADAVAGLARARHETLAARERLARLIGLGPMAGPDGSPPAFTLPDRLPALPAAPLARREAEQAAIDRRLDVLMARRSVDTTAGELGLTRATRVVDGLALGYVNRSETGEPRADGVEVEFPLPLFDFGSARTARAEAVYRQALHQAADVALRARSEVRESHAAYLTAYELARHYRDDVVPLRRRISEENLLRYNGMLVGVFDLLADAREQMRVVAGAVQALRDHWIADTDLQVALTGGGAAAGASAASLPAATAAGAAANAAGGAGH